MVTIDSLFLGIKRFFALERKYIVFAFVALTVVDAIVWAIVYVVHGTVPRVEHFDFLFWSWYLPFNISRLWDLVAGPLCIALFWFLAHQGFFYEGWDESQVSSFGLWATMTLLAGCTVTMYFGILYGLLLPLAITAAWAGWVLVVEMDDIHERRRK